MYKRILVPIDGSPTAKRGMDEALRLARQQGARVCLVSVTGLFVITPLLGRGAYVADVTQYLRDSAEKLLALAAKLARSRGVAAETALVEFNGSHAAEAIVEQARKWRADLIVMGTHGRRGISRFTLGSDADLVARTSPVPVLLVKGRAAR